MRRASLSEQNETKLDHDPELRGTFDKKNEANGFKSSHGDLALRMEPSNGSFRTAQPPEKDALDEKRPDARIWVETLDTKPDLGDPEYAGDGKFGRPCLTEAPVESVRGRPLNCFTEQNDPATRLGVHWVRSLGTNTASEYSFEIARGWLKQRLSSDTTAPKYKHVLDSRTGFRQLPSVDIDHAWTVGQIDPSLAPGVLHASMPARLVNVLPDNGRAGDARLVEAGS
ncbi:hypothetical protein MMC21_008060 [Puttea exsequens]|nr:hypothetical protein [Puttea exsequens]